MVSPLFSVATLMLGCKAVECGVGFGLGAAQCYYLNSEMFSAQLGLDGASEHRRRSYVGLEDAHSQASRSLGEVCRTCSQAMGMHL